MEPRSPQPPSQRFVRAVALALVVGLAIFVPEATLLGWAPAVLVPVAAAYFTLALALCAWVELLDWAGGAISPSVWVQGLVYGLGSLLLSWPVAATLFEGSFASTLPGAQTAKWWLPALAVLFTWLSASAILAVLARAGLARLAYMSAAALAAAALAEWANRLVLVDEHADLHTGVLAGAMVLAYLGFRGLLSLRPRGPAKGKALTLCLLVAFVGVLWVPAMGLRDASSRRGLAARGVHAPLVIRVSGAWFDFDQDGHSPLYGGADCDDRDSRRHPGARELPDNGIDENCDGFDGRRVTRAAPATDNAALRRWEAQPDVQAWRASTSDLHVVLISVDALRAELLTDTPEHRAQFPALMALRDESRVFVRAFSPAAGTDLSLATLHTGRVDAFASDVSTIAERLYEAGFWTAAIIPTEVLRYAGDALLTRGFTHVQPLRNDAEQRDVGLHATSHHTTRLALAAADRYLGDEGPGRLEGERMFLWAHYFDVHEHDELDPTDPRLRKHTRSRDVHARYAASLQLVDAGVADLRAGLEARGLWHKSIVIFTSDHGEGLDEAARLPLHHGKVLYNELIHVPLFVRVPGSEPSHVELPVSLVDVASTLAHIFDLDIERGGIDGWDLSPELAPQSLAPVPARPQVRSLALYESEQQAVLRWPYKLIARPSAAIYELYNLDEDFGEQEDLFEAQPQTAREMLDALRELPVAELDRTRAGRRERSRLAAEGVERAGLVRVEARAACDRGATQPPADGQQERCAPRPRRHPNRP